MKKLLYFFVGCVLLGLIGSFIFGMVPVFTYSANGFFMTLKQERYEEAYEFTSDAFKKQYDLEAFKEFVKSTGLNKFQNADWVKTLTNKENTQGFIVGTITTLEAKKIPVKLTFVSAGEGWLDKSWRIQSIEILLFQPRR